MPAPPPHLAINMPPEIQAASDAERSTQHGTSSSSGQRRSSASDTLSSMTRRMLRRMLRLLGGINGSGTSDSKAGLSGEYDTLPALPSDQDGVHAGPPPVRRVRKPPARHDSRISVMSSISQCDESDEDDEDEGEGRPGGAGSGAKGGFAVRSRSMLLAGASAVLLLGCLVAAAVVEGVSG